MIDVYVCFGAGTKNYENVWKYFDKKKLILEDIGCKVVMHSEINKTLILLDEDDTAPTKEELLSLVRRSHGRDEYRIGAFSQHGKPSEWAGFNVVKIISPPTLITAVKKAFEDNSKWQNIFASLDSTYGAGKRYR